MSLKSNFFTERDGVNAFANAVNRMGCIWRETPMADIGIDGQVEHLTEEGEATASLVGVQVKSGMSYFRRVDDGDVLYEPSDTHREYWARFPIPVILVLYNPSDKRLIWTDVRRQLAARPADGTVRIPLESIFPPDDRDEIFKACGPVSRKLLDPDESLRLMISQGTNNSSFDLCFFDLFVHGMTSIARKVYFGMDLAFSLAELKIEARKADSGVGIGHSDYDFLHRYVTFLVEQRLIVLDWATYLNEVNNLQIQDTFVAPLTHRGRELVRVISVLMPGLIEERSVVLEPSPRDRWRMRLGEALKAALNSSG